MVDYFTGSGLKALIIYIYIYIYIPTHIYACFYVYVLIPTFVHVKVFCLTVCFVDV